VLPLHPMGLGKLAALSLCTFNLYQLVWFYRNWRLLRDEGGERVTPWLRALFAGFTSFALFDDVESLGRRNRVPIHWSPIPMGIGYLLLTASWRLPDPYWLVTLLSFLPPLWVQKSINEINSRCDQPKEVDRSFTGWTWLVIVLGGVFLFLALLGTFVPAEP
jgi:hypothetical protein